MTGWLERQAKRMRVLTLTSWYDNMSIVEDDGQMDAT